MAALTIGKRAHGFTLLELLVVLVIVGMMLGLATFSDLPSEHSILQNDAQRIALLLQSARDEAIVRNREIAFVSDGNDYWFTIRENGLWKPLTDDMLLRRRAFERAPVRLSLEPSESADAGDLRILFGREPVNRPFVLTLAIGEVSVAIHADGIGHFEVE